MTNKKILPIGLMILTVIFWGLSFLSIDVVVETIPPITLGFSRFVVASLLLFIIKMIKEKETKMKKKDVPLFAIAGFLGVTLYFIFENNGILLLNASTASLIIATIPIFSLISESIVYKVRMTRLKIISIILSFIGVYFIVGGDISKLMSSGKGIGYIMMFGAVLSWVVYALVTKPLFGKYSQLTIVYYQSLFGTIMFIPFIIFETTKWSEVTGGIVLNVLYLGIFCSAIGGILIVSSVTVVNLKVKKKKLIPTTHG